MATDSSGSKTLPPLPSVGSQAAVSQGGRKWIGEVIAIPTRGATERLILIKSPSESDPLLSNVSLFNLDLVESFEVLSPPSGNEIPVERLPKLDLRKQNTRIRNASEEKRAAAGIRRPSQAGGNELFTCLCSLGHCKWDQMDIVVADTVRLVRPYRQENVQLEPGKSAESSAALLDSVQRVVAQFHEKTSKS